MRHCWRTGQRGKEILYDSFGRILDDTNPAMHVPLSFGFAQVETSMTRSSQGAGLGLVIITKQLVGLMGGGPRFTARSPATPPSAREWE